MSRRKGSLNNTAEIQSVNIWIDAYEVTLKNKPRYEKRLKELQTWDTCNGHESERQTKIQALKELLK